jgi:hypothetical protein
LIAHSIVGTEKRGLLVKSHTVVRDKDRGDVDGVSTKENRRAGIDGKVSSRSVGSTHTTVAVRGTISFTRDKVTTVKVILDLVGLVVELQHHVVHLSRLTVTNTRRSKGLEPMAVSDCAVIDSPVRSSIRNDRVRFSSLRIFDGFSFFFLTYHSSTAAAIMSAFGLSVTQLESSIILTLPPFFFK